MNIPITKTYFGSEELQAVQEPLTTGWVVQGPHVKTFEDKFAAFSGTRHAIATTSCTTALHISVTALGLKPGQEVVVPAFTWISTANVAEFMGAKPVFCDIDLATFNIDISQIEKCITEKTVGIIPVHLFGLCADMDPILELARRYNLWVVEDAACALGTKYKGQHAGTFGDTGCFSFHPRKSITTGEGGMITTSRDDIESLSRTLRDHGASRTDLSRHTDKKLGFLLAEYSVLGYNYRMTDIQGALGSVQMDRAAWILSQRSRLAERYTQSLSKLDWLDTPFVHDDYIHGFQAYVCLFRPESPTLDNAASLHQQRNKLMEELQQKSIATRQGTHAPVILDYYKEKYNLNPEAFPNAFLADRLSLTLPLYPQMTDEEQDYVIEQLTHIQG